MQQRRAWPTGSKQWRQHQQQGQERRQSSGGSTEGRLGYSAARRPGGSGVRRLGCWAARLQGGSAARLLGGSAARLSGCSVAQAARRCCCRVARRSAARLGEAARAARVAGGAAAGDGAAGESGGAAGDSGGAARESGVAAGESGGAAGESGGAAGESGGAAGESGGAAGESGGAAGKGDGAAVEGGGAAVEGGGDAVEGGGAAGKGGWAAGKGDGPQEGRRAAGLTLYARTMKQAGVNPSPEADAFHPESRPNKVNQSLRAHAAIAREHVELLQTDCKTKDVQILKALGIAGSLADAVLLQKIVSLDFERMMSETLNDFLFDGDHMNMAPKRSDVVERLVGFTWGSDEASRLVAHMKDKDIVKKTEKRFNNRIGKIYGGCRRSLRLVRGARLFVIKRAPNGTIRAVEPDDFAARCHAYVAVAEGHRVAPA
ncbi:unnamed protein product [Closterium sp. NIES-64]|nr:unnamed protein product [Closterium sp. NIES-64]